MKKLGDILPKVTARYELDESATASQVLEVAEQYLLEIFDADHIGEGKKIAAHKLKNGTIFFKVSSSGWNNRLFLEKTGLLEYLRKEFPKLTLTDARGIVSGE